MPPGTLACTDQDARKTVSSNQRKTVKALIFHPSRHFTFPPHTGESFPKHKTGLYFKCSTLPNTNLKEIIKIIISNGNITASFLS